jgi:hypothetical protein
MVEKTTASLAGIEELLLDANCSTFHNGPQNCEHSTFVIG